jgi:ABC-type branched-subunit amino acid transport system substrate-binding protein
MRSRAVLAAALAAAALASPAAGGGDGPRPVRVGLLLPADAALAREISRGAAIAAAALARAGAPVEIVERRPEGPWGSEAGRVVAMVYADGVDGIVTGPDRGASHLAAQVAAKAQVPVIVGSGASALTRVPLPWVFRSVPDERRVLDALGDALPPEARAGAALAFVPADREGERLAGEIAAARRRAGAGETRVLRGVPPAGDLAAAAREGPGAPAFVALPADGAAAVLRGLRAAGWRGAAVGLPPPGAAPAAWTAAAGPDGEGMLVARLLDPGGEGAGFAEACRARGEGGPTEAAAAAHDAVLLLARAARAADGSGEGVRAALRSGSPLAGATGPLSFAGDGSRAGAATVAEARGGTLRPRRAAERTTERKP